MSSSKLPANLSLISITCDQVAEVLDLFRRRNANLPPSASPKLLVQVKTLLEALHRLEDAINHMERDGVAVDALERIPMNTTLNSCGSVAKVLQLRIVRDSLQDTFEMDREISSLVDAVNRSFEMLFEQRTELSPEPAAQEDVAIIGIDIDSSETPLDPDSAPAALESLREENTRLKAQLADLHSHDEAKIYHINQLHSAIKTLNKLHPPRPQSASWQHLRDELPHMINIVEETNDTLGHLESSPSTSSRPSHARNRHSHTRSTPCTPVTPLVGRSNSVTQAIQRRPPSPTESTVSSIRSETPTIKRPKPGPKRSSGLFKFVQI